MLWHRCISVLVVYSGILVVRGWGAVVGRGAGTLRNEIEGFVGGDEKIGL